MDDLGLVGLLELASLVGVMQLLLLICLFIIIV